MVRSFVLFAAVSLAFLALSETLSAQSDPPKREFRAVWVATVTNLDWPSNRNASSAVQQAELIEMFDAFAETGINAVIFQVRTEGDALYESELEPWSYWLTGQQGRAPEPFYDPLAFAIEEAHKRGMELHAWFNPYRMERSVGAYPLHESHPTVQNPDWVLQVASYRFLDPGLPQVRDYVTEVLMDVVRRYDVDAIHMDDYFYPYPPNTISNQDDETFEEHNRGFFLRGDWRRDNVNLLLEQIYDSLQVIKPHVKFGMSPFGIWRSGTPPGIVGLDAYSQIYADAVAWMEGQYVDYLVPQLYWAFGGGQDYGSLAPWWESVRNERHLYTGHANYKSDSRSFSGSLYAADEVPRQVRFNREHDGIDGSVFFRANNIHPWNSRGFTDTLRTDLFRYGALPPVMDWKDLTPTNAPENLIAVRSGAEVTLSWDRPEITEDADSTFRYAVYRFHTPSAPDLPADLDDARNLLGITGLTAWTDEVTSSEDNYYYVVTALSRNNVESEPSNIEEVMAPVSTEDDFVADAFQLYPNYPNPFNPSTTFEYAIREPASVTVAVYNAVGQRIRTLVSGQFRAPGRYTATWDGRDESGSMASSGVYFYTLESGGHHASRAMTLLK